MNVIAYLNAAFSSNQLSFITISDIVKYKGNLVLSKIHIFSETACTTEKM